MSARTKARAERESGRFRPVAPPRTARSAASRKPRLLFRFVGVSLLRFAAWQLVPWLFQLPPRFTRFEAIHRSPTTFLALPGEIANWKYLLCA